MSEDFYFDLAAEYEALGDAILPQIIPAGTDYVGTVVKCTAKQSNKGKLQINVTLRVDEGPNAGKTSTQSLYFSPESPVAARIFRGNLATLGATPEWLAETHASPTDIAAKIEGAVISFNAKVRQYNGEDQNDFSFRKLLSPGGQGVQEAMPQAAVDPWAAPAPAAQQAPAQPAQQAPQAGAPAPAQAPAAGGWPAL